MPYQHSAIASPEKGAVAEVEVGACRYLVLLANVMGFSFVYTPLEIVRRLLCRGNAFYREYENIPGNIKLFETFLGARAV